MDDIGAEMSSEAFIDAFQKDKLYELIPVIVVMAIVCVLGTIGNSFTIAFYGFVARRTPTIFLITVLACVDLAVCILIIAQITEMAVNVKFTSAAACKIVHFLGHWAVESSVVFLWFIAIDRYRHVCCPFQRQLTYTAAKRTATAIIITTFLLSVRDFINFDIIEFPLHKDASNTTDVIAHYCTTSEDQNLKLNVTIWHSLDAIVIVATLVTLCVTYGRIIWVLKTGTYALDTEGKVKRCSHDETIKDTSIKQSPTNDEDSCINELENKPEQSKVGDAPRKTTLNGCSKLKTTERSITLMMMVVSIVFGICLVPYFIVKIGIRSYKSASKLELGIGTQFAIRFVYVNSFANPFVFCCFNPQFRRFIGRSLLRLKPGARYSSTTVSTGITSQPAS